MMNSIIQKDLDLIVSSPIINWEVFKGQTVLITGANGMLPSYLAYTLLYLNSTKHYGIKVLALVRNLEKSKEKFKDFLDDPNLEFIVQDVATEIKYTKKVDYIIHAASQASPKYYGVDPVGTINANVLGTVNVLECAYKKKVKSILYFSSSEIYGYLDNPNLPVSERECGKIDPCNVRSCYAESKRIGENLCIAWNVQYNTHAKIIRPFHNYGPGISLNDGRVFADFCRNVIYNENIILRSNGQAKRAFCYLTDAVIAFFIVLLRGKDSEAYNVGNPDCEISILELANKLVKLFPKKQLQVYQEILENDMTTFKMRSPIMRSLPDITKLQKLGWSPKITIEEGFKRTIESYSEVI